MGGVGGESLSFHRYLAILIHARVPIWETERGNKSYWMNKETIVLCLKMKIYEITFFLSWLFWIFTDFKSGTLFSFWFSPLIKDNQSYTEATRCKNYFSVVLLF